MMFFMEIKKNIRVGDESGLWILFATCARRTASSITRCLIMLAYSVITFFAPEAELDKMDTDEMCDFVYSRQGIEIVETGIAVITAGLYEACEAEMKDRKEKYMKVFDATTTRTRLTGLQMPLQKLQGI